MKKILLILLAVPSICFADSKVSQLVETLTPATTDYAYTVSNSTSMKVKWSTVLNLPASSTSYLNALSGGSNIYPSTAADAAHIISSMTVDGWAVLGGSFTATQPWAMRLAGVNRLALSADGTATTYQTGGGNNLLFTGPANTTAVSTGLIQFKNLSAFSTNSSGQSIFMAVTPTINSSSSGGNTDFLINRTQSAVGSGSQFLLDAQVGGVTEGSIDNTGIIRATGGFISVANSFLATVNNTSSANNARIQFTSTGLVASRNVADGNPALTVNQINASSTGDILDLQAISATLVSVGVASMTVTIPFNAKASTTSTAAPLDYYGAYASSNSSVYAPMAATTVYSNIISTGIGPGDWRCSGVVDLNTTGVTMTSAFGALSLYSGNATTDHVANVNVMPTYGVGTIAEVTGLIPTSQFLVSVSTTIFLKGVCTYAIGSPTQRGTIICERGH